MRIMATSDLHGNLEGLDPKGADVVVLAGDIAPLRGRGPWHVNDQKKWINKRFREWTASYPDIQFVVQFRELSQRNPAASADVAVPGAAQYLPEFSRQVVSGGLAYDILSLAHDVESPCMRLRGNSHHTRFSGIAGRFSFAAATTPMGVVWPFLLLRRTPWPASLLC